MKKQDRIEVVEEHTMWNSRVIFALFCLILLFGIVTGIGFYNIKQQIPKGEWECVEWNITISELEKTPCYGIFFNHGLYYLKNKQNGSSGYYATLKDTDTKEEDLLMMNVTICQWKKGCSKYQFVKYGDANE